MESITVEIGGPIFDGRARQAGRELAQAIVDRLANHALERVQFNLDGSIKNPTPYYETQINIAGYMTDRVINDRGVIYGNWLEGTSERNTRSRFKGYASFRRARQDTAAKVQELADSEVRQFIGRMGG